MSTKLFRFQHTYVLECGKGLMNIEQLTRKNLFHPKSEVARCWYQELASWRWEHMLNSQEENWNCRAHVDRSCKNRQKRKTYFIHTLLEKIGKTKLCEPQVLFCISWTCTTWCSRTQTKWKYFWSFMKEWDVNLFLWVNIVVKTVANKRHDDEI